MMGRMKVKIKNRKLVVPKNRAVNKPLTSIIETSRKKETQDCRPAVSVFNFLKNMILEDSEGFKQSP